MGTEQGDDVLREDHAERAGHYADDQHEQFRVRDQAGGLRPVAGTVGARDHRRCARPMPPAKANRKIVIGNANPIAARASVPTNPR